MSANLELKPESIKEKNSSHSSLTDLYHVAIFTDEFKGTLEEYQTEKNREASTIYQDIFVKDSVMQRENKQELLANLFIGKIEKTVREDYQTTQSNSNFYYGQASFVIILLFTILLARHHSKKKKEKLRYVVNSDTLV